MRHVFLTGDTRAGKSTLISGLLAAHPQWRAGGFRTFTRESDIAGALGGVYLAAADGRDPQGAALVGIRRQRGVMPERFPDVFDGVGARLLAPEGKDLLLMDELGFMENDAAIFRAAVLRALDGRTPVLGVVKPISTPFLDAVRAHKGVRLIEVTPQNREGLATVLDELMTRAVEKR